MAFLFSKGMAPAICEEKPGRGQATSLPRFVTASLRVDYLSPTPLGPELEVRGRATEVTARKVVVEARVLSNGQVTARGVVVAVRMPESMASRESPPPGRSG